MECVFHNILIAVSNYSKFTVFFSVEYAKYVFGNAHVRADVRASARVGPGLATLLVAAAL